MSIEESHAILNKFIGMLESTKGDIMLSELYDQVETYIPSLNTIGDALTKIEKVT